MDKEVDTEEAEAISFFDEVEVDDDLLCIVYDEDYLEQKEAESDRDIGTGTEEDDNQSDSDSDDSLGGLGATFPYMDSETDEDDLPWERRSRTELDDDIITLEDEEEEEKFLARMLEQKGSLICSRCPRDKNEFLDLDLYLIHQTRHVGRNHFMCVECKKPFIKYSFCLAHEIRKHGQDFPQLEFPAVLLAREYVKEKEEYKKNKEKFPQRFEWSEEEKVFEEIGGIFGIPEEDSCSDTDEEDPKFHPGHVVASTSLYPYRGPPVGIGKHHEAYEIQLTYGREKPSQSHAVSRIAILHRQQLEKNGFLPDKNRTSKYYRKQFFDDEDEECDDPVSGKTKAKSTTRRRNVGQKSNSSASSSTKNTRRKRTARRKTGDRKERVALRTFLSSIIRRTCLLCQYIWTTEAELREHRDQRHPNRKLLDLMTVITEPKKKKTKKKGKKDTIEDEDEELFQAIKIPKDVPTVKYSKGPEPELENFMASLGLISVQKLKILQTKRPNMSRRLRMSVRKQTRKCSIVLERLPSSVMPMKGYPVYVCEKCDYFVAGKRYLDSHRIIKHGDSVTTIAQETSNSSASNSQNGSETNIGSNQENATGKRKANSNPKGGTPKKKLKDSSENQNFMNVDEEPDWQSSTNSEVVRSLIGTTSSS